MSAFCKEEIFYPSADRKNRIAAYIYTPASGDIRAVIQLSHGMCEYICRYEPAIEALTNAGFAVCGNDHLGHGHSVPAADYGFIAEKDGYRYVLQDLYHMNQLAHERFPDKKLFLLGHSMGSFYARRFAQEFPSVIDGLIISGTGGPNPALGPGLLLAKAIAKLKGPRYVSGLMISMSTGSYCKGLEQENSPHAWLSRDPAIWAAYGADPMCTFPFTVSAYRDMLTVYQSVSSSEWAGGLRKDMPILLVSGDCDPVGSYGKGVEAVHGLLKTAGISDLTLKLYPGARHELHNETNKSEYLADLTAWIAAHI